MNIIAKKSQLNGEISVPGSKSHTIRAVLLASLAQGTSHIKNPLASADCLSAGKAIPLIGAKINFGGASGACACETASSGKQSDAVVSAASSCANQSDACASTASTCANQSDTSVSSAATCATITDASVSAAKTCASKTANASGTSGDASSKEWTVEGAGQNVHLPNDVVNVGNSGSLLYFMSAISATFDGWSVFTGDESIRKRPVLHVVDALNQLGAFATVSQPTKNACPLLVKGPVTKQNKIVTEGSVSSQYITGLMMSACRLKNPLEIELTNPKETPYLTMTQKWLEKVGIRCDISDDFKHIKVFGPKEIQAFDTTIPSDWEGVAFPLVAALISDSCIVINNIDSSKTQGDDAIFDILKSLGADLQWNFQTNQIFVRGGKNAHGGFGRLSTQNLKNHELHINISDFPDAICALAAVACFTEGNTFIEDAAVCRRKETDRIKVLKSELTKLGADVEEGEDFMIIHGHSPLNADGTLNPDFCLHGATVESFDDHRIAMSLACMGLGLKEGEQIIVKDAECCSVSFPGFFDKMNKINAGFEKLN